MAGEIKFVYVVLPFPFPGCPSSVNRLFCAELELTCTNHSVMLKEDAAVQKVPNGVSAVYKHLLTWRSARCGILLLWWMSSYPPTVKSDFTVEEDKKLYGIRCKVLFSMV